MQLAVSSRKRKINTLKGVQTDFGHPFASSSLLEDASSKLSPSDKIDQLKAIHTQLKERSEQLLKSEDVVWG